MDDLVSDLSNVIDTEYYSVVTYCEVFGCTNTTDMNERFCKYHIENGEE